MTRGKGSHERAAVVDPSMVARDWARTFRRISRQVTIVRQPVDSQKRPKMAEFTGETPQGRDLVTPVGPCEAQNGGFSPENQ